MTSDRRITANVANAMASTGPKSQAGKARSSGDAALAGRAEELALRIAGPDTDAETLIRARAIAEAQFGLERVRARRMRLLQEPQGPPSFDIKNQLQPIETIAGYESAELPRYDIGIVERALSPALVGADQRLIGNLDGRKLEFAQLERYERRVLSRRKSAIRDFDAHHRPADTSGGTRTK